MVGLAATPPDSSSYTAAGVSSRDGGGTMGFGGGLAGLDGLAGLGLVGSKAPARLTTSIGLSMTVAPRVRGSEIDDRPTPRCDGDDEPPPLPLTLLTSARPASGCCRK